jgi:hypothetical protein
MWRGASGCAWTSGDHLPLLPDRHHDRARRTPRRDSSAHDLRNPQRRGKGLNDEVEVSGNWEGTQPLVTKAGVKNAKIKAPIVVAKASSNFEITLEDTTIETTDTMSSSSRIRRSPSSTAPSFRRASCSTRATASTSKRTARQTRAKRGPRSSRSTASRRRPRRFSTAKGKAIEASSGLKIDLADSSISATADEAIDCDRLRPHHHVGRGHHADGGLDRGRHHRREGRLEPQAEAEPGLARRRQAWRIIGESSFTIDGTSTSIEGGAGPGIQGTFVGTIAIRQSLVKGTPGIQIERAPTPMDLSGTRVDGGQTIARP